MRPRGRIGEDGSVKVRDLWTRFSEDQPWVHRGLSLDVAPGESVAIIGGSGAGKSVLLRTLIGLHEPESGSVEVDGLDVTSAPRTALYGLMRQVGVVFQFGALFDSLPVWENVTFALRERGLGERDRRRIAAEKLHMVGLAKTEDRLPGELSGGMRKRVGLARAIAHDPRILLCDEPTSGLDPIMSDTVSELILQLKRRLEVTAVTITHDMKSAYKIADRIAMLYQGRLRAFGTPDEIRASDDPIVQQFIQGHAQGPMSIPGEPG